MKAVKKIIFMFSFPIKKCTITDIIAHVIVFVKLGSTKVEGNKKSLWVQC